MLRIAAFRSLVMFIVAVVMVVNPKTRLWNFRGDAAGRTVANHGDQRNRNAAGRTLER